MFDEDEGPKDWEIRDEDPPESLKKKWEEAEMRGSGTVRCFSCGKEVPAGNLACIFCGAVILRKRGSIHCFLAWVKRLFRRG